MPHHASFTLTPINVDTKDATVEDDDLPKEDVSKNIDPKGLHTYRLLVTVTLFLTWVVLGIWGGMGGTTFIDQRDRLGATTDQMTNLNAVLSFALLFSNFLCGIIVDMTHDKEYLFLAISLLSASVLLTIAKLVTSFTIFFVLNILWVLIWPGVDFGGNLVTLRIWGEKSSGPLYAVHLGWGVGTIFGPFIARPFLSPDIPPTANCTLVTCSDLTTPTVETPSGRYPEGSRIEIPYLFAFSLWAAMGIVFLCFYKYAPISKYNLIEKPKDKPKEKKSISQFLKLIHPSNCANGSNFWAVFFLVAFFLYYFILAAREMVLPGFLVTYAVEGKLEFTKQDAAVVNGIFNAFYMMGRLISIVISRWLPIQILLSSEMVIIFIFSIALSLWGLSSQTAFKVCVYALAFFTSPIWPGGISWTDKYITLTAMGYFVLTMGYSSSGIIMQPIYGQIMVSDNMDNIMYAASVCGVALFILFALMQSVGIWQGTRFHTQTSDITEKEEIEVIEWNVMDKQDYIESGYI